MFVVLSLILSCAPKPSELHVSQVWVRAAPSVGNMLQPQLQEDIKQYIKRHAQYMHLAKGRDDGNCILEVLMHPVGREGYGLSILLRPLSGKHVQSRETVVMIEGDASTLQAQTRAAVQALVNIQAQHNMMFAHADTLLANTHSEQLDEAMAAVDAIGARNVRKGIPRLIEMLAYEDQLVRLRVMGALVRLRAQEAVPKLIEMTRQEDPRFVQQVLYAIAQIGGRDAEGFLLTVATGHPDETTQQSAQEALDELKR